MPGTPVSLVFVCKKNGGKSQIAAALMRAIAPADARIMSAGTHPTDQLNVQSVESLTEIGVDIGDEHPKPLTASMLEAADLIVVLGDEAKVEAAGETPVETWITDEPSERGIEGEERMRLVRDDIRRRVETLRERLWPKA